MEERLKNQWKEHEEFWAREWKEFCDYVASTGKAGKWFSDRILRHIVVNAPVLLGFCTICVLLHIIKMTIWDSMGQYLGVHDTWDTFRLLQYTSLITHIFAHADIWHLRGNMMHLLLTGPSVEHAFGSKNLLIIILVVAVSSAFAHIFIGRNYSHQLGASGVVFACILLNSLVSAENGKIPLSFILTALLYLGEEFVKLVLQTGATSHHAHLVGGVVGAIAGFYLHKQNQDKKTIGILNRWRMSSSKTKKR